MIQVQAIQRKQGGLHDITLNIAAGACTAIVGPNGAGKSTLLDLLAGRISADSGLIRIDGRRSSDWPARQLAQRRAFMAQTTEVAFSIRVQELVALGRAPYRASREMQMDCIAIETAMRLTDSWHLRSRIYQRISGGERQRVQLARVIAQIWRPAEQDVEPRMLLLDEPTASLDPGHRLTVMRLLRHLTSTTGIGVLIALHDLNDAMRFADTVVLLDCGQVRGCGTPEAVLHPELLTAAYGVKAEVLRRASDSPIILFK